MRLSRNNSSWDFKLLGLAQFVPADIHPRLERCATCMAPLRLTPVGASYNVMPSSPFPADARCWVLHIQGLPVHILRGFGSPRHGGTSWFQTAMFLEHWDAHFVASCPLRGFWGDLILCRLGFFPRGFFIATGSWLWGPPAQTKILTWLQIGPGPAFLSFYCLRMPLALLHLPLFLFHCSPEDNKHFRNRFRDSQQGENKETQRQEPNQQTAEPGINSHGKPVFVYY